MPDPIRPTSSPGASGPKAVTTGTAGTATATATKEVEIQTLMDRYGWKAGEWQERLLKSADKGGSRDGRVSVKELDTYLANPLDGQFVASGKLVDEQAALARETAANAARHPTWDATRQGNVSLDKFSVGVERNIARAADKLGNADNHVSSEEVEKYIAQLRAERGPAPSWMPDQKTAAFEAKIAELSDEKVALQIGGETRPTSPQGAPVMDAPQGVQVIKDYMRLATDNDTRIPPWVTYVLSAQDMKVQGEIERPQAGFHLDPDQPNKPTARVTNGEYTLLNHARGSEAVPNPFDRGHMREAKSSVNTEAMYESFQTDNISTQYHSLNAGAWRFLEDATRELAMSNDGKLTVVTGNLFLDKNGKPLPEDKIDHQATTLGHKGLAIPTHCFKTVLLEKPNGEKQMFAWIIPNNPDMTMDTAEVAKRQQSEGWRVSVDDVEKLIGRDLYSQLDKSTQTKLERDPAARAAVVSQTQFKMANLFMGDGTYALATAKK